MQAPSDPSPPAGDDLNAAPLLTILLDHYPALMSLDELVNEFAGLSRDRKQAEMMVADGLAALMASGLIHRIDRFVFASRAAVKAEQFYP